MRDRVEVGVPDIAPPGVVFQRGIAGRMKTDWHIEFFEQIP